LKPYDHALNYIHFDYDSSVVGNDHNHSEDGDDDVDDDDPLTLKRPREVEEVRVVCRSTIV